MMVAFLFIFFILLPSCKGGVRVESNVEEDITYYILFSRRVLGLEIGRSRLAFHILQCARYHDISFDGHFIRNIEWPLCAVINKS